MSALQYIYAISVTAVKDGGAVNNQLFSGLADKNTVLQVADSLVWQFDVAFKNDIRIINCNLSEQCAGGMMYSFGLRYDGTSLEKCSADLRTKLLELLR